MVAEIDSDGSGTVDFDGKLMFSHVIQPSFLESQCLCKTFFNSQIHHAHLQIFRSLRAFKIAKKVCKK